MHIIGRTAWTLLKPLTKVCRWRSLCMSIILYVELFRKIIFPWLRTLHCVSEGRHCMNLNPPGKYKPKMYSIEVQCTIVISDHSHDKKACALGQIDDGRCENVTLISKRACTSSCFWRSAQVCFLWCSQRQVGNYTIIRYILDCPFEHPKWWNKIITVPIIF